MDYDDEETQAIILDYGSGMMKAGFAGDNAPRAVFVNIVGYPKNDLTMAGIETSECIGDKAIAMRGILTLSKPIHRGVVVNWDEMEKVWHHTFYNELRVSPSEHSILVTEPALNTKANRERIARMMFENFEVPAVYIACAAILSVYSGARTSAMVVESGDGVTYATPVWEGHCIMHAIHRVNLGGQDVSEYLAKLLTERGYSFTTSSEKDIIRNIKERLSFAALDYEQELQKFEETLLGEKNYELPDGNVITLGNEMFRSVECMFQPSLIGKECMSIIDVVNKSIQACDIDIRSDNYSNIILSGGNTLFQNFGERLKSDIRKRVPPTLSVRVVAYPERKYLPWLGASILASLSTFQEMWFTKDDYEDEGPEGIHEHCTI